jgi:UDP-N-acetylglucosamine:LPS N-acetylglucosamine transferase
MKVCLACSGGGHLSELLQLRGFFEKKDYFFLTDHRENSEELAKKERVLFVECPRRNPIKLAKNFFNSLSIFLREKPDVVLSTGADTAVAFCIIARLFGKKLIFVESFCRVTEPSLSARILYPFSSLFFVQWPEMKNYFKKAVYAGSVF